MILKPIIAIEMPNNRKAVVIARAAIRRRWEKHKIQNCESFALIEIDDEEIGTYYVCLRSIASIFTSSHCI